MDRNLREIFGAPALDLLSGHRFSERSQYDDANGLTREYANGDFGIQLRYSIGGRSLLVMPRGDLANYFSVEYVIDYLCGEDAKADKSFEAAVRFVDEHYTAIAALFSNRDGGSALKALNDFIYQQNARRFHYDRVSDSS